MISLSTTIVSSDLREEDDRPVIGVLDEFVECWRRFEQLSVELVGDGDGIEGKRERGV
jgi:hypothetical protein